MVQRIKTVEEYLGEPIDIPCDVIELVTKWKKDTWYEVKDNPITDKYDAIAKLISSLGTLKNIKLSIELVVESEHSFTRKDINHIVIGRRISIISGLHEFCHVLYPEAEERWVQRWAAQTFKKTFPISFKKLKVDGDLLKKK